MEIICYTNLDLFNEVWPTELPCRPMKGDYIQSKTKHPQYKWPEGGKPIGYVSITLEVHRVTFKQKWPDGTVKCYVELHDKSHLNRSINDFYEWYAPIVNKNKSYFI